MTETLNKDNYDTVKAMIESPDPESVVLGLQCIENSDLKDNLVYILLMMKEANVDWREWRNNAPIITQSVENVIQASNRQTIYRDYGLMLTYDFILKVMRSYHVSREDYDFFMEHYAKNLLSVVNDDNDNNIVDLKITLKHAVNES